MLSAPDRRSGAFKPMTKVEEEIFGLCHEKNQTGKACVLSKEEEREAARMLKERRERQEKWIR